MKVAPDQAAALIKRIEQILSYEPRIGLFGKTGAGKSSLCNALFGSEVSAISDVAACTRNPQEIFVQVGAAGVKLIDCPGIGESQERDGEYRKLYAKLLPELDVVLLLVKADDRALSSDEEFFKQIVLPNLGDKPFFVVLSQTDKIEPFRDWNEEHHIPGAKQQQNINAKCQDLAHFFHLLVGRTSPVSAREQYNLVHLVNQIVFALPKERKVSFVGTVKEERTKKQKRMRKKFFSRSSAESSARCSGSAKSQKESERQLIILLEVFLVISGSNQAT